MVGFVKLGKVVFLLSARKYGGGIRVERERGISWIFGNGEVGIDLDGKIIKIEFMKRRTNISLEYIATISAH